MKDKLVQKADGTTENFNSNKLLRSLLKAGASQDDAESVVEHISSELRPGATTKSIYDHAFQHLKSLETGTAARYSLRRSLAELGPTGFPFEYFIAELLAVDGYETEVGVFIEGECAQHEVDVIAKKRDDLIVAEVKFHNQSSLKSDLKVALYVNARFEDLEKNNFDGRAGEDIKTQNWLITNTKFTSSAIRYGECNNLNLLGWGYPEGENLEELITRARFEPVTALTTLSKKEKEMLMNKGTVLCRTIRDNAEVLEEIGLASNRIEEIQEEASKVCHL